MHNRPDSLLINDILLSIEKIRIYTRDLSKEAFMTDDKTLDAVIRNFEIIGEAANRISEEVKEKFTQVNWFRIRGFRNRIVHDYMGIDYEIVWSVITEDLESLHKNISEIQL